MIGRGVSAARIFEVSGLKSAGEKELSAAERLSYPAPMRTILLILLILLLLGALPLWPYSSSWGYFPGGGLVLLIIIVLVLVKA